MEKKSPGRPRLYESGASKVEAFRKRMESAGFIRREVLVTKDTWEQVSRLAAAQGVGVVDAASALLEQGLLAYQATQPMLQSESVMRVGEASAQVATPAVAAPLVSSVLTRSLDSLTSVRFAQASSSQASVAEGSVAIDPITQFFNKRRETLHAINPPNSPPESA